MAVRLSVLLAGRPPFTPRKIPGRKLHNEELHNLYFSPNIIRMIKSRRIRRAGHVARMRRRGMHIEYWLEIQKKRDH
jgi:hypothetical protein